MSAITPNLGPPIPPTPSAPANDPNDPGKLFMQLIKKSSALGGDSGDGGV